MARRRKYGNLTEAMAGLLFPTPAAGNFNDGEDPDSWEARRQRNLAKGYNGNGQGTPLGVAVQALFPTPRATDGTKGAPNQRGSSGDLMLPSAVHQLLRTPTSNLAINGGSQHPDKRRAGGHQPTLADEVEHLLPTPMAADGQDNPPAQPGSNTTRWGGVNSLGALAGQDFGPAGVLLPTPEATDSHGHHRRGGDRADELLLPAVAEQLEHDGGIDWGPYAFAVYRWARVTGLKPPSPVERGRSGKSRLSPRFVEWMQGLPPGWVTDVPKLSRNAQLKALGNGVVPQQGLLALLIMLPRVSGLWQML